MAQRCHIQTCCDATKATTPTNSTCSRHLTFWFKLFNQKKLVDTQYTLVRCLCFFEKSILLRTHLLLKKTCFKYIVFVKWVFIHGENIHFCTAQFYILATLYVQILFLSGSYFFLHFQVFLFVYGCFCRKSSFVFVACQKILFVEDSVSCFSF